MLQDLRASLAVIVILSIVLCGVYPLAVWGIGQLAFHKQANGSLLRQNGQVVGSGLIAQNFTGKKYFHPRPSAAGDYGYDAANSNASNLGPLSKKLCDQVKNRVAAYRVENDLSSSQKVPADAVTGSASGLDPDISLENARLQAPRVARARKISAEQIRNFIARFTTGRQLGFLGEPRVNVLRLNLALDQSGKGRAIALNR
ncbi:MAG: K(+)-transporting ATPase subunit C [Syntrophobacteraceae bacterium]